VTVERRKTRRISLGGIAIGDGAPISVQTMTKTHTTDVEATLEQIDSLARAGCDIVRLAVENIAATDALKRICPKAVLPIVADIHFDPRLAIASIKAGASGVRINPGNMPDMDAVHEVVTEAKAARIPIRIGLNSGSARRKGEKVEAEYELADLMVARALDYAKAFESWGFEAIKLSMKASTADATIYAYRRVAEVCDYPLHVGVTATGAMEYAVVKSAVGIGALLSEGIGDTIRVSLTGPSIDEVRVGREILASLALLTLPYEVISCPTCGRTVIDVPSVARAVEEAVNRLPLHKGPTIRIAVMGCEVNGPGEAADADVGVACGKADALLFRRGEKVRKLAPGEIVETLVAEAARIAEGMK
jgi:(E)-4-hydroxy-3-methylbut-2-enyl-diphosphate synthase